MLLSYSQPHTTPLPRKKLWLAATSGTLLLSANTLILAVILPSAAFRERLPQTFTLPACFLLLAVIALGIPLAGAALLRNALLQKRLPLLGCLLMALLSLLTSGFMTGEFLHISGGMEFLLFGSAPALVAIASFLFLCLLLSLLNSPQNPAQPFEPREFRLQRFLESICSRTSPIALLAFILTCISTPLHEFNHPFHLFNIPLLRPALYALNTLASGGLLIPLLLTLIAAPPFHHLLRPNPLDAHHTLKPSTRFHPRWLPLTLTAALLATALTLLLPTSTSPKTSEPPISLIP